MAPFLLILALLGAEPIQLFCRERPAAEVIAALSKATGEALELDPELAEKALTLDLSAPDLAGILPLLAKALGAEIYQDGARRRLLPPWRAAQLKILHGQRLTMKLEASPLGKVLNVVATYSGVNLVVDGRIDPAQKVTIDYSDTTIAAALDNLAEKGGFAWDVRWGVIFIGPKERLEGSGMGGLGGVEFPKEQITFSFEAERVRKVVETVALYGGLRMALDEDAEAALADAHITMQVKRLSMRHAMESLLLPRGLTATIHEGELRVTPIK